MAGFATQFSLSLELTNVIPHVALAAGKTYEAAMRLARELQSSGSDIVVEEDLALFLGRCQLAPNISSSFRTIITQEQMLSPIMETIALVSGPGPTLLRAMTQSSDSPLFAMVVQCSLLVSVHDYASLGSFLARSMEREVEDAPHDFYTRSPPSIEGIRGVLRAIEDQSSSFDWQSILLSIARHLELSDQDIHQTIPATIFQCLTTTFASVQRFPEERHLVIETDRAACVLVAWAHHVLGLSTRVVVEKGIERRNTLYGSSPEQVLLVVKSHGANESVRSIPSVTMLSADDATLFTLEENPQEGIIDATLTGPANGYARRTLEPRILQEANKGALITDLMSIVIAIAATFNQYMHVAKPRESTSLNGNDLVAPNSMIRDAIDVEVPGPDFGEVIDSDNQSYGEKSHVVTVDRLQRAAELLFNARKGVSFTFHDYIKFFAGVPLYEIEMPPGPTSSILRSWDAGSQPWTHIRLCAISLSIVVFAFAQVSDLSTCGDVYLCEDLALLRGTSLFTRLALWDGMSILNAYSNDSFEVISVLMSGGLVSEELSHSCLISSRGWSLYVGTITETDPARVGKGLMSIRKGVPCRKNVWKHSICDVTAQGSRGIYDRWKIESQPGDMFSMCNKSPVHYQRPFCGEKGDTFLISVPLVHQYGHDEKMHDIFRTGYSEMFSALWLSERTQPCTHVSPEFDELTLPPGCIALSGFSVSGVFDPNIKVCLYCTSGNKASRWRALLATASIALQDESLRAILLRDLDCCLRCAVDQALVRNGQCFVIL